MKLSEFLERFDADLDRSRPASPAVAAAIRFNLLSCMQLVASTCDVLEMDLTPEQVQSALYEHEKQGAA